MILFLFGIITGLVFHEYLFPENVVNNAIKIKKSSGVDLNEEIVLQKKKGFFKRIFTKKNGNKTT